MRAQVERALGAHYELDCEIGRGGMGIVYRAKDRRLKRTVAIKVLPPELAFRPEIKTRFLREAETAAGLNHANIVDIYSVDEAESLVYFVMAYISGDNLARRLHDRGPMDVEETRQILRAVADALAYAHERGVIHRDIKPDNILLDADNGRPMVTDFGIARAVTEGDSRLTATGIAIGTPTYMSPEQAAGDREIDGRSDLYALGVVAYQMLTGQPPFSAGSTPAILVKHISERPVPVEQLRRDTPVQLARVVMTLLEKDPNSRFDNATALVAALDGREMLPARRESSPSAVIPAPSRVPEYAPSSDLLPPATPEELVRWEAPEVRKFRGLVIPYLYINAVIIAGAAFTNMNLMEITVLYSIFMAYKYAKLWTNGFDWRDVFRQPRERELIDVADETLTSVKRMLNSAERSRMREERHARAQARRSGMHPIPAALAPGAPAYAQAAGSYGDWVRRAYADRDEILRILERLRPADRARVPDVGRSANALAAKVQALAVSLADAERTHNAAEGKAVDAEIAQLESAANPLEAASEDRVRRLAMLKRSRRAFSEAAERRKTLAAKLDTCGSALEGMKFDLLRLSAGSQTHHQITALAMEAMSLAESVDSALHAVDEVGRITSTRPGSGRSAAKP